VAPVKQLSVLCQILLSYPALVPSFHYDHMNKADTPKKPPFCIVLAKDIYLAGFCAHKKFK